MKRFLFVLVLAFAALGSAAFIPHVWATSLANVQEERHGSEHEFGVKQYESFHDVLRPLQHEALPQNDFRTIRAKSPRLAKKGNAIVRLGVPRGTRADNRQEFARELKKFSAALTKFRSDARRGTDDQLKASFSAVHDSFEMLAAMLPRE